MLIGNKADLMAQRAVKTEEGVQVAKVCNYTVTQRYCTCRSLGSNLSSSSFICSETQTQYSAKIKTWTLDKTHQVHDKFLWWPLKKHKYTKYTKYTKYKIHVIKAP